MTQQQTNQAAHNNAVWCDIVCRAHRKHGEFLDDIWINRQDTPRFYPNAVTLTETGCSDTQIAHINDLAESDIAGGWVVKDSFCSLDLTPLQFRMAVEAQWIYRVALQPRPEPKIEPVEFRRVGSATELAAWEVAWGGEDAGTKHPELPRIFLPPLLADEDVVFIAAYRNQQIVAGAIGNRTGDVVGLSNVFVPATDGEQYWAGCVACVMEVFKGLPKIS